MSIVILILLKFMNTLKMMSLVILILLKFMNTLKMASLVILILLKFMNTFIRLLDELSVVRLPNMLGSQCVHFWSTYGINR